MEPIMRSCSPGVRQREQDSDAQVEAIEDHVDQDRQPMSEAKAQGSQSAGLVKSGSMGVTPQG
jgi:hypothetical protein